MLCPAFTIAQFVRDCVLYFTYRCISSRDTEWRKCCLNFGLARKGSPKAPPCFPQAV